MADRWDIDSSDLFGLAADIDKAPRVAADNIRKAIEVTSRYIRDDWRSSLSGARQVPYGEYSVTYDIAGGRGLRGTEIVSEIGPDRDRSQGSIVGLIEEGSATLSPRGYGLAALLKNQPDFEAGLEKAIGDVL